MTSIDSDPDEDMAQQLGLDVKRKDRTASSSKPSTSRPPPKASKAAHNPPQPSVYEGKQRRQSAIRSQENWQRAVGVKRVADEDDEDEDYEQDREKEERPTVSRRPSVKGKSKAPDKPVKKKSGTPPPRVAKGKLAEQSDFSPLSPLSPSRSNDLFPDSSSKPAKPTAAKVLAGVKRTRPRPPTRSPSQYEEEEEEEAEPSASKRRKRTSLWDDEDHGDSPNYIDIVADDSPMSSLTFSDEKFDDKPPKRQQEADIVVDVEEPTKGKAKDKDYVPPPVEIVKPKTKLPPIRKNKNMGASTGPSTPTNPSLKTSDPTPLTVPPRKPPATTATQDFDLRNENVYKSLFANKGGAGAGASAGREERAKELAKMRDEAKAKRAEQTKQTFDIQGTWDKISRYEEVLYTHYNSRALYPNIIASAFWTPKLPPPPPHSYEKDRGDTLEEGEEGEVR